MTENRAKAFLEIEKQCINRNCDRNCAKCDIVQKVEDLNSAYDTAIKALEEVQQYRAIGTPEELKSLKENGAFTGMELAQLVAIQMSLREYEKIGTVEECREALEKQTAKKPEFVDTRFMNNGKHISDGCQLQKCYKCPNCNQHIFHVWDDELYCKYCGQHIDWRDEVGKTD